MGRLKEYFNFRIEVLVRWCFGVLVSGALLLWCSGVAYANNIDVDNVSITAQNTSSCKVEFDIAWDNSWRDSINYDAAWVFIKYSTDSGATWSHATLKTSGTNPSGFSQGSGTGLDIVVPSDKMGAFLQRSAEGTGSVDTDDIQFVWDWGTDGLSASDTARLKVFVIEMVYIPEGAFYAGDDGSTADFQQGAADTDPWYVNDSDNMVMGTGEFYYTSAGNPGEDSTGTSFTILAAFPNGFDAFYLMKYEITQGQYAEFLNTLTQAQQNTRVNADLSNEDDAATYVLVAEDQTTVLNRQNIKAGIDPADGEPYYFACDLDDNNTGWESADGEWIACNYVSWMDVCAYADWAALRPMTELELEKACRGPNSAILSEAAWATTYVATYASLNNAGQANEAPSAAEVNCNYSSATPDGPGRVGMFATSSSTREQAGAGYYGNMELSGNLWELPVTVGNATGRSFEGTHGDGELTTTTSYEGNATNTDWPGIDGTPARGVTGATGSGARTGSWGVAAAGLPTSYRGLAASTDTNRYSDYGGRLGRTAP